MSEQKEEATLIKYVFYRAIALALFPLGILLVSVSVSMILADRFPSEPRFSHGQRVTVEKGFHRGRSGVAVGTLSHFRGQWVIPNSVR